VARPARFCKKGSGPHDPDPRKFKPPSGGLRWDCTTLAKGGHVMSVDFISPAAPLPACRHCQEPCKAHRRGLCRHCYQQKDIRRRYPPIGRAGEAGAKAAAANGARALPETATASRPGSEARIEVLQSRALQGVTLRHPGDLTEEIDRPAASLPPGFPSGWMRALEVGARGMVF
jgi:hypothetical protein